MKGINLVVISSKNCSPCKSLKARLLADNISYIELDSIEVDYDKYNIMSVPVMILEDNGVIIEQMNGFNVPDYKRIIEKYKSLKNNQTGDKNDKR